MNILPCRNQQYASRVVGKISYGCAELQIWYEITSDSDQCPVPAILWRTRHGMGFGRNLYQIFGEFCWPGSVREFGQSASQKTGCSRVQLDIDVPETLNVCTPPYLGCQGMSRRKRYHTVYGRFSGMRHTLQIAFNYTGIINAA